MGKPLVAKVVSIDSLTPSDEKAMFSVFEKYYANINFASFTTDLHKKDDVILLLDRADKTIKGFSTIMNYTFKDEVSGKEVRGVFSGDTILDEEYWGGTTLQTAFALYMCKKKLQRPFSPYYWFLICKGYKTYLLLVKNVPDHYPRFSKETPLKVKKIMDAFASSLYPESYDAGKGLIDFKSEHDCLKNGVAPITKEMMEETPAIGFFAKANPTWNRGTELVCLGNYQLRVPIHVLIRMLKKKVRSFMQSLKSSLGGAAVVNRRES